MSDTQPIPPKKAPTSKQEKLPPPEKVSVQLALKRNCGNCYYGRQFKNSALVECVVDLPPFVQRTNDPKKYRVHKSYSCFAHKTDKTKVSQ